MARSGRKIDIKSLYYITHVENIPSILRNGILSHTRVESTGVKFHAIYDADIVSNRKAKIAPNGHSLWDFANLYFQARNPMLYRVVREKSDKEIAVLGVRPDVLQGLAAYVTDGNAASSDTEFHSVPDGLKIVSKNWKIISSEWWNSVDGSKRKIMAECLVPDFVPSGYVHSIFVANHGVADHVRTLVGPRSDIEIVPEPNLFFTPARRYRITDKLYLAEGDMFFSSMQTLTVSVNTVGVMGKGLASRARYQFPDVYVAYEDACRRKKLTMGKPFLYKRESSLDDELADEPALLSNPNSMKWFLLFATKSHWREDSDFEGIRQGLQWLAENYKKEGMKSIALPALGCGLGNLKWEDVGPMMCQSLAPLDIPARIFLPREREIPDEFLTPPYLLRK